LRTSALAASVALIAIATAAGARGDDADVAASEALFRDGKRLLEQKDFARACPELAESFRLDPATGTLLALALCHEGEGRLATAWTEYGDAAARARIEGRADRAEAALQWARALEPRLSTLTVAVPEPVARTLNLRVKRDGVALGVAAWGIAVPVDPGEHVIEVTSSGKEPWQTSVLIRGDSEKAEIVVPPLKDSASEPTPGPRDARRGLSNLQRAGLVTAGLGVVAIGASSFFGLRAIHLNDVSKNGCDGNACDSNGMQDRLDAITAGNLSTAGFLLGSALLLGGAAMYFVPWDAGPSRRAVRAVPAAGARTFGLAVDGSF
jgi:hypothetical protein